MTVGGCNIYHLRFNIVIVVIKGSYYAIFKFCFLFGVLQADCASLSVWGITSLYIRQPSSVPLRPYLNIGVC